MRASILKNFYLLGILGTVRCSIQDEGTCGDFTVNECSISEDDLILESDGIPLDLCQLTCDTFTNCVLFRFTHTNETCQLINKDFRQNCQVVGGDRSGDLGACLNSDLNGCNAFIEESCVYGGEDLAFSPPDGELSNPYECENLCKAYEALGCNYWVYSVSDLSCRLITSGEKKCEVISGPQAPSLDECGVTTTQPITTAAPCPQTNFTFDDFFMITSTNYTGNWTETAEGGLERFDNGEASVAFSDAIEADIMFNGTFSTTDTDDDWVGIAFGIRDKSLFYLIAGSGNADPLKIMLVNSTTGSDDTTAAAIVSGESVPGQTLVLHSWPEEHWEQNLNYTWSLTYRPGSSIIFSLLEGSEDFLFAAVELNETTSIQGGDKIGVFSYSQPVLFTGMSYVCV